MDVIAHCLIHEDKETPLCPLMNAVVRSDPKGRLCDIPADLRKRFLGNTPCSAQAGCIPRKRDPEAVQDAQLDGVYRMYHLRSSHGAK